ncbi:unnamed protein product [Phytomonas sp. Hart1]|nr:unnamed protein product [Phytomonas sp. Hart1]|eukprot:CCW68564.1 unnamed protein product [Phytomonas sp. isolate Hart1]
MIYEGVLKGHRDWITSLACPQEADSTIKVVSASRDGTAISWVANPDRHSSESDHALPDRRLEGHTGFIASLSLAHTNQFAVTASWDHSLRLWNLRSGQCEHKFLKHTKGVLAVAFSPDDRQIVSGGRDHVVRVWNVMGECMHELTRDGHEDWVSSLCFSPSLERPVVVSGSWDHKVKVWDLAEGRCRHTLEGHTGFVTTVTVSPDGSLCASGGKEGVARLWAINTGESLFEVNVEAAINQIAFSPNRFWMCVATEKNVRVYDLEAKKVIIELTPETTSKRIPECTCVAWSADGNTLYTGYTDNLIRVWSISDI